MTNICGDRNNRTRDISKQGHTSDVIEPATLLRAFDCNACVYYTFIKLGIMMGISGYTYLNLNVTFFSLKYSHLKIIITANMEKHK